MTVFIFNSLVGVFADNVTDELRAAATNSLIRAYAQAPSNVEGDLPTAVPSLSNAGWTVDAASSNSQSNSRVTVTEDLRCSLTAASENRSACVDALIGWMTSEGTPQDNWWRSAQKPSRTTFDCAIFLFAQPSLLGSIVTVSLNPPLSKRAQLGEPTTFNSFTTRLYRLSVIADILQLTGN